MFHAKYAYASLALVGLSFLSSAQSPVETERTDPQARALRKPTDRWIVMLKKRSFHLSDLRKAILARHSSTDVAAITARYNRLAKEEQQAVVRTVRQLGGRVTKHFWIVNGCAVTLPETSLEALRSCPDVHSAGFTGSGGRGTAARLGMAVVDAELSASGSPLTTNPHQVFDDGNGNTRVYVNRTAAGAVVFAPTQTPSDHGLTIGSIAAGRAGNYAGASPGQAPNADLVSVNIVNQVGMGGGAMSSTRGSGSPRTGCCSTSPSRSTRSGATRARSSQRRSHWISAPPTRMC